MLPTINTTAPTMNAGLISGARRGVPPMLVAPCWAQALVVANSTTLAASVRAIKDVRIVIFSYRRIGFLGSGAAEESYRVRVMDIR